MKTINPKLLLGGVSFFCFALLAYAWFLQYGPEKQQPCPLCVLQRYVYILLGLITLVGALHRHIIYALSATVVSACGVGLALWQVLKGSEMLSCQRDPIGIFVNGLPTADWFPEYFFANGGCADKYVTLGLPVPVWSLICFGCLILACAFAAIQLRKLAHNKRF
jgi:protein dithiol:quinone oxidoreductase